MEPGGEAGPGIPHPMSEAAACTSICFGESTAFTVAATGTPLPHYAWYQVALLIWAEEAKGIR